MSSGDFRGNVIFFETMKTLESFVESVEGLSDGSFAVASAAVDVAVKFDVAPLAEDESSRVHSQEGENLHVVVIDRFSGLNFDHAGSRLEVDSRRSQSSVQVPLARVRRPVTFAAPYDYFAFELAGEKAHARMFDSAGFVPRRAQILFLPNAVASGSAGDVANGGALGIVADCGFVAVVDRLVDAGISWLGVWTVFLQFISVTFMV